MDAKLHDFQGDIDDVQRIAAVPTILDVVCRATGMGFAAVARVTDDRWIACQVLDNLDFGLQAGGELKVETTLCNEVRQRREVVVIDNVAEDAVYCTHHTPSIYGLQSYISVPIILPDGRFFGTLCAIDPKPAKLNNPQVLGTFKLFAELIAHHLDSGEKLKRAEAMVSDQRATAELREQFIAILGHDLRNPLASIQGATRMLMREPQTEKASRIIALMRASTSRMSNLIDNILDFARGRLGGGLSLQKDPGTLLAVTLDQVILEIRAAHPDRTIEVDIDLPDPIHADGQRIAQMMSNILGNAITHGDASLPILVDSRVTDGTLVISVANGGNPIPAHLLSQLFEPFRRGGENSNMQGLGLGLFIASQIAEAHGGRIDAASNDNETRFTFTMPMAGNLDC